MLLEIDVVRIAGLGTPEDRLRIVAQAENRLAGNAPVHVAGRLDERLLDLGVRLEPREPLHGEEAILQAR